MSGFRWPCRLAALVVAPVFAVVPALGQDSADHRAGKIIDELKFGVLDHDITLGERGIESGADLNGEVLFASPGWLAVIGAPRPHLGVSINTDGNTDDAYFGLTWGLPIVGRIAGEGDALTVYGSLGGALQDGYIDSAPAGRKRLGSVILFRESVELGYQITAVNSLSVIVDHISNANLAKHNAGITSAGVRFGIKF